MGRTHHAPCAQHLVEGDDSRRRATPSTPAASLLHLGGPPLLPCSTQVYRSTSLINSARCCRVFFVTAASCCWVCTIPAIDASCRGRSRHGNGLIEQELQVGAVPILWVLLNSTLIFNSHFDYELRRPWDLEQCLVYTIKVKTSGYVQLRIPITHFVCELRQMAHFTIDRGTLPQRGGNDGILEGADVSNTVRIRVTQKRIKASFMNDRSFYKMAGIYGLGCTIYSTFFF